MNFYSKEERYVVALDVDGTLTRQPFTRAPLDDPPQDGFIWFYEKMVMEHPEVIMVIHTSRNFGRDDDYWSTRKYLLHWGLNNLYLPKRDGKTFKSLSGEEYELKSHYGVNVKLPFAVCIDDRNIGTPTLEDGELDWEKIYSLVEEDMRKCREYWENNNG